MNIMTTGGAIDLGDLQTSRRANGAFGSPVRGVVVAGCTPTIFGNIEFFFEPKLKIIKIAKELITINKLAFVNEISKAPILISGPIL